MKKGLKYLGYAAIGFVALGIIAVASDDTKAKGAENNVGENSQPLDIPFTIAKKEPSYGDLMTYRIVINERVDKASAIEIARKLRAKDDWKGPFVCFFSIKVYHEGGAWANCTYALENEDVATDKDADGNLLQYFQIGATPSLADSLKKLSFDSIDNKQLVCSYIEDIPACKTELYTINNNPSKIMRVKLFNDGAYLLDWFTLKPRDGQKRYYFDEAEDSDNYMLIDESARLVHFQGENGKTWYSAGFE